MWLRSGVLLLTVASTPAFAAPRIAVHPLGVTGTDAKASEQSVADFVAEAARQPIQMVSRLQVAEVLAEQKGGSCAAGDTGCLETLCKNTGATYALFVTLLLDGPDFVLTGKVVDAKGVIVRKIDPPLAIAKDLFLPKGPQVGAAFKKLFEQLDLGALPEKLAEKPVAVVEVKPTPVPEPVPVVAAEPEVEAGTSSARVGGVVFGGLALASAGVGAAFAVIANGQASALRPHVVEGAIKASNQQDEHLRLAHSIDTNTYVFSGLFAVAGAAAITSIVMLAMSSSSDQGSPVVIAPVEGGAMIGVMGRF